MIEENGSDKNPEQRVLGKFKSVDALAHAYSELEAEFTRRSQKLKAYEEAAGAAEAAEASAKEEAPAGAPRADDAEALYRAVTENEGVRARIVGDYLQSLRGVPLMGGSGVGVTAPAKKPANIKEANALALGYLRQTKN